MGAQGGFAGGKQLAAPHQQPQAGLELRAKAITACKASPESPQLLFSEDKSLSKTGGCIWMVSLRGEVISSRKALQSSG